MVKYVFVLDKGEKKILSKKVRRQLVYLAVQSFMFLRFNLPFNLAKRRLQQILI